MDSISCQWAIIIFISFEVKRENTDWLARSEKARVSQLDLNCKQCLWCGVGIINYCFSLLQGRPEAPTLYILILNYYYYLALVDLIFIAVFKWLLWRSCIYAYIIPSLQECLAFFCPWAIIFICFQVKQENTDWMIRMEKARVS